jgi:pilus assembly protein Flp/PilA
MRPILRFIRDKKAASAVEYALILALIFLAMLVSLQNVANSTINMWNTVENKVTEE